METTLTSVTIVLHNITTGAKTNLTMEGKPTLQKVVESNTEKIMHTLDKVKGGKIRHLLKYSLRIAMSKTTS